MNRFFTNLKSSPILLIILALTTLLSSFATNLQYVSAAGEYLTYSSMTTQQKVISYEYYKALSECVKSAHYDVDSNKTITIGGVLYTIVLGDASNTIYTSEGLSDADVFSKIFNVNDKINIGLLAEEYAKKEGASTGSSNGVVSCTEISKAAYKFWNLNNVNIDTIFTSLGFDNSQSNDTVKIWTIGSAPKFDEFIKTNIYEGSKIELDDGLKYYIYNYFLQNESGCGGTLYNTGDNLIISSGGQGGNISVVTVKVSMFSNENKLTEYIYKLNKTTLNINTAISIHYNTSKTCIEIASGLTEVAKKMNNNGTLGKYLGFIEDAAQVTEETVTIEPQQSSCNIDGIGWIVCPVLNFAADIADSAFVFLSDSFLNISPKFFDTSGNTYTAWNAMRSIANVAFAVAFLVIIYSQMTGFGITNYGVKKMLPRLIVAAILVNVSYFLCQIAVDISNILGGSLKGFFDSLIPSATDGTAVKSNWGAQGNLFTGLVGGAIIGVIAWAAIATLIPVLISAVVGLIMILFMLVGRQALVILLVVVSPIAFVAYLLPNTNSLFKQWKKIFTSMLMLFPIIALVFGMSNLASGIIASSYSNDEMFIKHSQMGQIISAAVLVLPLFAVPVILKKSLNSVGNIGATINGLGDKLGKGLGGKYTNSSFNQFKQKGKARRAAETAAGTYAGKNPFRRGLSYANKNINNKEGKIGKMMNTVTGGYTGYRSKGDQRLKNEEIAKKAEALANEVDPTTGFTKDPRDHYDAMRAEYVKVNADDKSTAFQKREAGINLGAANTFLLRTEGRSGVNYVQREQKRTGATDTLADTPKNTMPKRDFPDLRNRKNR